MKRLENDTTFYNWKNITLSECLCLGECKKGPNIKIGNTILNYIHPSKASDLVVQKIAETQKQEIQKQKASKNTKK